MNIKIRSEKPSDVDSIESVTIGAFRNAPYSDQTEHFIIRELREAGALTISLVAEKQGQVVGHVAVSPVTISNGATGWFGLGPIAVLTKHQNAGIGSRLIQQALEALKNMEASGCVLLGNPAYYCRFGFKSESQLVLPGMPTEYFQAIAFASPIPEGQVTYHEAFNAKG